MTLEHISRSNQETTCPPYKLPGEILVLAGFTLFECTDRQTNKLETIDVSSLFVCLSVCLSVGKINQKVADTFS